MMIEPPKEFAKVGGSRESFARMRAIVFQGSSMPWMYYLLRGKVKIEQAVVSGKSILLGFEGPGAWLGDLELFTDDAVANSTVTAVTEVEAVRYSLESMRQHLRDHPKMTEFFARSLAQKMWRNSKSSAANLLYPLRDRYAAYLYEMSAESSCEEKLPIALETSAGQLGAGERQLQRVLRDLADEGLIARSGRTLTVLDRAGLGRIASDLVQHGAPTGLSRHRV